MDVPEFYRVTGGPADALPETLAAEELQVMQPMWPGLTILDSFAIAAMQTILASEYRPSSWDPTVVANDAYAQAEVMLRVKRQREGE